MLNKIIRYTPGGMEVEADPRHAEIVIRDLGLKEAKACIAPGTKDNASMNPAKRVRGKWNDKGELDKDIQVMTEDEHRRETESAESASARIEMVMSGRATEVSGDVDEGVMAINEEDGEPLTGEEATRYRAITARLNYLAVDRPDIQYAVKEAARSMATPQKAHWSKLTRIGRYLVGKPRLIMRFPWQRAQQIVTSYTDSDWAGCVKSARSTSGGIVTIGEHVIKSYSRQQKIVALSSAEAELYAMVAASAETLGIIAYAKDLGLVMGGEVYGDSTAALGIAQRVGIGKVRHLRTQGLWVQETRLTGRLAYRKVLGSKNPADVLTKHVPGELLQRHLVTLGVITPGGRAELAPELSSVESLVEWYVESEGEIQEDPIGGDAKGIESLFSLSFECKYASSSKYSDGGSRDGGSRDGGSRDGGSRNGGSRAGGIREGGSRAGGIRAPGARKVRFNPKVSFRAVPHANAGKEVKTVDMRAKFQRSRLTLVKGSGYLSACCECADGGQSQLVGVAGMNSLDAMSLELEDESDADRSESASQVVIGSEYTNLVRGNFVSQRRHWPFCEGGALEGVNISPNFPHYLSPHNQLPGVAMYSSCMCIYRLKVDATLAVAKQVQLSLLPTT